MMVFGELQVRPDLFISSPHITIWIGTWKAWALASTHALESICSFAWIHARTWKDGDD